MYNFNDTWENFEHAIGLGFLADGAILIGHSTDILGQANDTGFYGKGYCVKMDAKGTPGLIKHYSKMGYFPKLGAENGSFQGDGSFRLNFSLFDTLGDCEENVLLLDTATLDTLRSIKVEIPSSRHYTRFVKINGNKEYRGGVILSPQSKDPFILITDLEGHKVAYKHFVTLGEIYEIHITKEGNILFSGRHLYDKDGKRTAFWYGLLDSSANIIWEKIIEDTTVSLNFRVGHIASINQHYYMFTADKDVVSPYLNIGELNIQNGELLWKKKFWNFSNNSWLWYRAIKGNNGSLFTIGDFKENPNTNDEQQYATLVKQSASGDVLWKRYYQEANGDNTLWNIHFAKDGFLLMGEARDSNNIQKSNAWLIKTDTFGCVVPGCQLKDGIPQIIGKGISFIIYPNPSATDITVKYRRENKNDSYSLNIFDVAGKLVYQKALLSQATSEIVIPTIDWVSGTYLIQLVSNNTIAASNRFQVIH